MSNLSALTEDPGQNCLYIRLLVSGRGGVALLGNSAAIAKQCALPQPLTNTLGVDEIILTRVLSVSNFGWSTCGHARRKAACYCVFRRSRYAIPIDAGAAFRS